jgi:hypothetical protein
LVEQAVNFVEFSPFFKGSRARSGEALAGRRARLRFSGKREGHSPCYGWRKTKREGFFMQEYRIDLNAHERQPFARCLSFGRGDSASFRLVIRFWDGAISLVRSCWIASSLRSSQ